MNVRRLCRYAVAGATLAAAIGFATPASASVRFDLDEKTGYIDRIDVQNAFGWTDTMAELWAPEVTFEYGGETDDVYTVTCGAEDFTEHHYYNSFHYWFTTVVTYDGKPGTAADPGRLTGFRLTGTHSGISATSTPPMVGEVCRDETGELRGTNIERVRLVSSTSHWGLAAEFGGVSRGLLGRRTTNPVPAGTAPVTGESRD